MAARWVWVMAGVCAMAASGASGGPIVVAEVVPAGGLVMARLDLAAVGLPAGSGARLRAVDETGAAAPCQFVADEAGTGGLALLRLRPGRGRTARLSLGDAPAGPAAELAHIPLASAEVSFTGGFPGRITFTSTGKVFEKYSWNDRAHDPKQGGFSLQFDPAAQPQLVSSGPICTVVRSRMRYMGFGGVAPASRPEAVYEWFFFRGSPLVYVTARVTQRADFGWAELHFLEMNFPGADFTHWAGGEPEKSGPLMANRTVSGYAAWAAMLDGPNAIAMIAGPVRIYDGRGEYGTYLHGPWEPWTGRDRTFSAWFWIGSDADAAARIREAAAVVGEHGRAYVTDAALRAASARAHGAARTPEARWRSAIVGRLERAGRLAEARTALRPGSAAAGWTRLSAGDLGLALERTSDGIRVASVCDTRRGAELLAERPLPLFAIHLSRPDGAEKPVLRADSGWRRTELRRTTQGLEAVWDAPERFRGLTVRATAASDAANSAVEWRLSVTGGGREWAVDRVAFPQVALGEPGPGAVAFVPRGPGEELRDPWKRGVGYRSVYPNGWGAMQYLAAYAPGVGGLYAGCHDPYGGTKELALESDPGSGAVNLGFEHPAPNAGRPGNGFALTGRGVWKLLRGDWYDAAAYYRGWVRREAKWWPKLGPNGREDTPAWMRDLCAWAQTGGSPAECVDAVKAMQTALGMPIGFHWYSWHVIPFDNDYPHYLPERPGVADAIADLQAHSVHVMPYINGRLWDTRDRGLEDWQFSKVALPAVAKQADGAPITESYGSKESDGSPVKLGVMCPTTPLWQAKVREIVAAKLMKELGVHGVYIDQIAAASPALCMDPSHGHPLGGGHWWTEEGYWKLLDALRAAMPRDRMITTECNGEPYVRWFDGYLTWHWQGDGMVPAFPAVYGGAVQMFGRAYGGGETRVLASRMKAAQQLVFGEQIGWCAPALVTEEATGPFVRRAIRTRQAVSRYFSAGEMARPLRFAGNMPRVRADWAWYGETWVTTDAVLTGTWRLPREDRTVVILANVGDSEVRGEWRDGALRLSSSVAAHDVQAWERRGRGPFVRVGVLTGPGE